MPIPGRVGLAPLPGPASPLRSQAPTWEMRVLLGALGLSWAPHPIYQPQVVPFTPLGSVLLPVLCLSVSPTHPSSSPSMWPPQDLCTGTPLPGRLPPRSTHGWIPIIWGPSPMFPPQRPDGTGRAAPTGAKNSSRPRSLGGPAEPTAWDTQALSNRDTPTQVPCLPFRSISEAPTVRWGLALTPGGGMLGGEGGGESSHLEGSHGASGKAGQASLAV